MKLNNQKRWGKMWSVAAGLMVYSLSTTWSFSDNAGGTFPNGLVFYKSGIVWEGSPQNVERNVYEKGARHIYINSEIFSNIGGAYWGSVDGYYGVVIGPGIVFTLSGLTSAKETTNYIDVEYQFKSEPIISSSPSAISDTQPAIMYAARFENTIFGNSSISSLVNKKINNFRAALYISPTVKPGDYSFSGYIFVHVGGLDNKATIAAAPFFTLKQGLQCTINTPPKIDFGKVNIWDWEGNTSGSPGGNRKDVLGVVDGNFMINCTGNNGTHSPAKLTLNGTIYSVTNNLKMTMDATGELAPATVRASIKTIHDACATKGTNFGPGSNTPPANQVDLGDLTIGSHQIPYRFSLCSLGEGVKFGAASATATVTLDWE
ncbi:hypothetical protein QS795_015065 [Providencia zhijiangensis]|uniref:Pilin (Type 1 fimbria component protein) n=1 Tax=Providencia zhijiangensis TaxID=3053982 RepID=A0ABZ0N079_9GAMM|nr:hypothetical protein [Providencia sp. D4759]WPA91778.1 hypothetical protein QS795_015065 [Providencia sp. D4759]